MAITVNVEIYGPFADIAGTRKAKVELVNQTIGGLLQTLENQWGRSFTQAIMEEGGDEFNLSVLVLVNHRPVYHLQGLRTELKEGDTVVFIPPAAGGNRHCEGEARSNLIRYWWLRNCFSLPTGRDGLAMTGRSGSGYFRGNDKVAIRVGEQ